MPFKDSPEGQTHHYGDGCNPPHKDPLEELLKKSTHVATWTRVNDPMYYVECPHCQATIWMSSPSIIQRMKDWAKRLRI